MKPSGKTGGFSYGNEKETGPLRLRLQQFFVFVQKHLATDGDVGKHLVCVHGIQSHTARLVTLLQLAFNAAH